MHTIYTDYTLQTYEIPTFFAGANTGNGFVSEYPIMAAEENLTRLWILKGGSGTGKSTFMRKLTAESSLPGRKAIHYLCSSDPDSLDAVVFVGEEGQRYAVVDGTFPHVWEMQLPGAVSDILYLGKYWQTEKLLPHRDTLTTLQQAKKEAYTRAYGSLAALAKLEESQYRAALAMLDIHKMSGFCTRLLERIPKNERGKPVNIHIPGESCRTWALSKKGLTATDGLWRMANVHWQIDDCCQTGVVLLTMLSQMAKEQHIHTIRSLHPINDRIVELWIPVLSLHLTMGQGHREIPTDKTISMQRFLQKEHAADAKGDIRLRARLMQEILEDAGRAFVLAGKCHAQTEEIYVPAMDFGKWNREMTAVRKRMVQEMGAGA